MGNVAVVGAQWGDEGKGKIVDWLSERADVVVRFQGGNNAGHTLVVGNIEYKMSLLPSGVVRPGKLSIIGNGVVVDPWALAAEIEAMRAKGLAIGIALGVTAWTVLVALTHAFPSRWPLAAAAAAAAAVLLLSFVAPVVLEPLFNRFRPLEDERLAQDLRNLADRAGVPVRDVLVADASGGHYRASNDVAGLCDDLRRAIAQGHRRFKIKIGGASLADDIKRIEAVFGVLEPGMVLCVESYIGRLGGREGVKIEDQILITETGNEKLSAYPLDERLLGS